MKIYEIEYVSYEGRNVRTTVEVDDDQDESDAQYKAITDDEGWGDGIHIIIGVSFLESN
jgi:hypothetical protein